MDKMLQMMAASLADLINYFNQHQIKGQFQKVIAIKLTVSDRSP